MSTRQKTNKLFSILLFIILVSVISQSSFGAVQNIDELIAKLKSSNSSIDTLKEQVEAIDTLKEMGETAVKAVPVLLKLTSHQAAMIRIEATNALKQIGPTALPYLTQGYNDLETNLKCNIINVVSAYGEKGINLLLKELDDENSKIQKSALKSLGKSNVKTDEHEGLLSSLILLSGDSDPEIAKVAIETFNKLYPNIENNLYNEELEKLALQLGSADDNLVHKIRRSVSNLNIGSKFVFMLKDIITNNEKKDTRILAIKALREISIIKTEPAIPVLLDIIKSESEDIVVKRETMKTLGKIGKIKPDVVKKVLTNVNEGKLTMTINKALNDLKSSPSEHPFLLISEVDYLKLQKLATRSPWSELKNKAITYAKNYSYDQYLSKNLRERAKAMRNILSKSALAYILDPNNRNFYKNKIRDTLQYWDRLFADRKNSWTYCIPAGSAFFISVLALDVVHDELNYTELKEIEKKMEVVAEWLYKSKAWPLNRFGSRGIWALYNKDYNHPSLGRYLSKLQKYVTADGVFTPGPSYAHRIAGSPVRFAKAGLMHILSRLDIYNYYSDEKRFAKLYEWYFGYAAAPTGRTYTFGDSSPTVLNASSFLNSYAASHFSKKAAGYAANHSLGDPPADLLFYVLYNQPTEPLKPVSKIFWDGGAWFMEEDVTEKSLAGAMWNATIRGDGHMHRDTNSINLSAYGEDIVRNVGYNGWGNGARGFSWEYINNKAIANNVVLIDNKNHQAKTGGGISEGFTTSVFDYASGDSGNALPVGKHQRNFVFVHPQKGSNGYFILFDEVISYKGAEVNVVLHPNSDKYKVIENKLEYQWQVGPNYTNKEVFVNVFLGTIPDAVDLKDGLLVKGHSGSNSNLVGKYLYSTYGTDNMGNKNIVTVIYPSDNNHSRANMTRITNNKSSGVQIDLGDNIIDTALESSSEDSVNYENISYSGHAIWYRLDNNNIVQYFIRKGNSFNYNNESHYGFKSDSKVSMFINESEGTIISPGTDIIIYYPDIKRLYLNGREQSLLAAGDGWIKVNIPQGTHKLSWD